jgi:hypothetical protein
VKQKGTKYCLFIKSGRIRLEEDNKDIKNMYKDLIGKHEMKKPLETSNRRSGDARNVRLKKQK